MRASVTIRSTDAQSVVSALGPHLADLTRHAQLGRFRPFILLPGPSKLMVAALLRQLALRRGPERGARSGLL